MISHSGSNSIFAADIVWLPEQELFIFIQSNNYFFPAYDQSEPILSSIFEEDLISPPVINFDENAELVTAEQKEGIYRLDRGKIEVTSDDIRLIAKLWGQVLLDKAFGHTEDQKMIFERLNSRVQDAMNRLKSGNKEALRGIVAEGNDPVKETGYLLRRIEQIGNLMDLHVIGSFKNEPGTPFAQYGPWTTFVYAEFANWNQYWNLIWNEEKEYLGNASGPWPQFILVPTGENQYKGVRDGAPWNTIEIEIVDGCLVFGGIRACVATGN